MLSQWQNNPVAEMLIKGHQNSVLGNGSFKYLQVIRTRLTCFESTHYIMTSLAQGFGNTEVKHLIEIDSVDFSHPLP